MRKSTSHGPAVQTLRVVTTEDDRPGKMGMWVEVEVVVDSVIQKIRSGGLFGIEQKADPKYLQEVAAEEYEDLKSIARQMGVKALPALRTAAWVME